MPELGLNRVDLATPAGVHCFVSTRQGGFSEGSFAAFNLAVHVGDDAATVRRNRKLLLASLQQQCVEPALKLQWMQQVHGTRVWRCNGNTLEPPPEADALYTAAPNIVLGVLTADCLPVLLCSEDGKEIAVAHAGWRGLCNGVLEATLENFNSSPAQVRCWLGPAIGPCHFEVGNDVRDAFLASAPGHQQAATAAAFMTGHKPGKWQADLYALARLRLLTAGVQQISGQVQCTVCDADRYYSYRQQAVTGRFATLIVRAT